MTTISLKEGFVYCHPITKDQEIFNFIPSWERVVVASIADSNNKNQYKIVLLTIISRNSWVKGISL